MCGILGYYAFGDKRPQYDQLINCWIRMKSRGEDGCGMVFPQDDIMFVSKTGDAVDVFLGTDAGKEEIAELKKTAPNRALFHTRKATWGTGSKSAVKVMDSATAHPFCHKEKVIAMHNGQIKNVTDLAKKYKFDADLKVDSQCIPIIFYENNIWEDEGYGKFKESVSELSGAFTIAAMVIENDKIFLATNNERPLVFAYDEAKQILYFCSELIIMAPLFVARTKLIKKLWNMTFEKDEVKYNGKAPYTFDVSKKMIFVIGPTGIEHEEEFVPKPYYHYAANYGYSTPIGARKQPNKTGSEKIKDGIGPIVFLLSKPANLDSESRCDNFIKACSINKLIVNEENKKVVNSFSTLEG